MNPETTFIPPYYLKNTTLQTMLASSKLRTLGRNRMRDAAIEQILFVGGGVRLQGFYSKTSPPARGLVILIHGWEGSAGSAYIVSTGRFLFNAGYDVFRLNLRDHGESHSLNEGLFFGTLLEESFNGVKVIAGQHPQTPVYLLGFSMGGNFAIRIARHTIQSPIPNLKQVFCINPPLDPMQATLNIDRIPLIRKYFIRKWRRSLTKNQRLYPEKYDFSEAFAEKTCWGMTELLLNQYSDYRDPALYFGEYTLKEGYLDRIELPLTIVTAEDDPIIAVDDFRQARLSDAVELAIQPFGGHCGYIQNLKLTAWYWQFILKRLERAGS
ncbi:alpha/beta fold hydrolase [bacterium]|nr:alpha/beta fold hydrolase [bacterium]